ncbi:MAG: hypothetical protein J4400_06150 [Candidatus Aenigmarchaeota archaeon]|nr:hypothetical protein [Candidatus Aenigmarchaeota archaeon]
MYYLVRCVQLLAEFAHPRICAKLAELLEPCRNRGWLDIKAIMFLEKAAAFFPCIAHVVIAQAVDNGLQRKLFPLHSLGRECFAAVIAQVKLDFLELLLPHAASDYLL